MLDAIRLTDNADHRGVMQDAVQDGVGDLGILKYLVPRLEVHIGREDGAALFIPHIN